MDSKNINVSFGVVPLLGIAFIILKLCGVIHWSWWLVTLPLWGGVGLAFSIFVLVVATVAIAAFVYALVKKFSGE